MSLGGASISDRLLELASSAQDLSTAEDIELLASSLESLALSIRSLEMNQTTDTISQPQKKQKKGET